MREVSQLPVARKTLNLLLHPEDAECNRHVEFGFHEDRIDQEFMEYNFS